MRSKIIFKNRSHVVSYSAISSAEASGSTSSYGRNSESDSSEFAVRYTDDHSEDFVSDQKNRRKARCGRNRHSIIATSIAFLNRLECSVTFHNVSVTC